MFEAVSLTIIVLASHHIRTESSDMPREVLDHRASRRYAAEEEKPKIR